MEVSRFSGFLIKTKLTCEKCVVRIDLGGESSESVIISFSGSTVPIPIHLHHTMNIGFFFQTEYRPRWNEPRKGVSDPDLLPTHPKFYKTTHPLTIYPLHLQGTRGRKEGGVCFLPKGSLLSGADTIELMAHRGMAEIKKDQSWIG